MMCYRSRLCLMIIIFIVWAYKVEEKDGRLRIDTRSLRNFRLDRLNRSSFEE